MEVLPWYRKGGLHLVEVGHGIMFFAVQRVLMRDLIGFDTWWAVPAYLALMAMCILHGRLGRSQVDDDRWFFCCVVMPCYFATFLLGALLPNPLLTAAYALVLLIAKVGVCMSVCLHRYASHGAFKCGPVTSFAIEWLGCLANQGGPVWWASQHRSHHKYCDAEPSDAKGAKGQDGQDARDPHSPVLDGAANAFAFFTVNNEVKEEFAPRHCDSIISRVLGTFAFVPPSIELTIAYALLGPTGLWSHVVSAWGSQLLTLWFNVVNHMPDDADALHEHESFVNHAPAPSQDQGAAGDAAAAAPVAAPATASCQASDTARPALTRNLYFWTLYQLLWVGRICGEGAHGHHHDHLALARRPGIDLPYHLFVRPLGALGLIWDIKDVVPTSRLKHA